MSRFTHCSASKSMTNFVPVSPFDPEIAVELLHQHADELQSEACCGLGIDALRKAGAVVREFQEYPGTFPFERNRQLRQIAAGESVFHRVGDEFVED